jgi:hypothetical protein
VREDDVARMAAVLIGRADMEVCGLEARLRAAQLDADVAALDALLDEALLFTGPNGMLATKQQDLSAHGSGAVRFREHVPEELQVRRASGRTCGCGRGRAADRGASSAAT